MTIPSQLVHDLLSTALRVWRPRSSHGLTLVPLFGAATAPAHLLASEAIAQDLLTISELDQETVPQLIANNLAELPVLLLDGEHLVGAKQNRIMNTAALIAAGSKTLLPVSCVEAGRWHYEESEDFGASASVHSYSRLRGRNKADVADSLRSGSARHVDQQAVWDEVDDLHVALGVESPHGAMADAFDASRGTLDAIASELSEPEPSQTGVIACVGGRPIALDLFDRPETLQKLWQRLIAGYAMDAITHDVVTPEEQDVKGFIADATTAEATEHEGIGLGTDVVITGDNTVGSALTWEGGVVHLAVFPKHEVVYGGDEQGSFASPSQRAERFRRLR